MTLAPKLQNVRSQTGTLQSHVSSLTRVEFIVHAPPWAAELGQPKVVDLLPKRLHFLLNEVIFKHQNNPRNSVDEYLQGFA